jgi:UDP-N-acetylmuramate dehydrogenase
VLAIQLDLCSANLMVQEERGGAGATLSVGAGVRVPRLQRYCLGNRLGGLEFLVGIPGMLGGALAMNAGTKAGSIAEVLLWIEILDENNRRRHIPRSELSPRYRSLGLPTGWVILSGGLEVARCAKESYRDRLSAIMQERKKTQPLGWPSAGCIFKNPEGFAAGALIEKSGLIGMRVGDAEVSLKHANWIVNRGRAKARDVLALIERIERRVEQDSGIRLEREIRIMGL